MGLVWNHYCTAFAPSTTPSYVLSTYHSALEQLPWSMFLPDLSAIDAMMKLKMTDNVPSFVFLGKVFPLFDWKTVAAAYRLETVIQVVFR